MRRAFRQLGVLVAFAFLPAVAAEWQQTNGLYGGSPNAIAMHPANPKILLTGVAGLYRTEDGGDSWKRLELPADCVGPVSGLAFSPANPDIAYCTIGGALIASHDAGKTWQVRHKCWTSHMQYPLVADSFDPDRVYLVRDLMRPSSRTPLEISEDGGKTFKVVHISRKLRFERFHCDPNHKGVLLADAFEKSSEWPILISRDSGETWTEVPHPTASSGERVVWHNLDPEDKALLYVATRLSSNGRMSYWYTYDGGETWELFFRENAGIEKDKAVLEKLAALFPPEIELKDAREQTFCNAVFVPSNRDIAYYISRTALCRTLDGGKTWSPLTNGLPFHYIDRVIAHPTKPATAFCRADRQFYRTDDLGAHWTNITPEGVRWVYCLTVHPLRPDTLLMAYGSSVWRSDDDGKTWRVLMECGNDQLQAVLFDPTDPDTLHFIHRKTIRSTTDDGKTWDEKTLEGREATGTFLTTRARNPIAVERFRLHLRVFIPGEQPYALRVGKDGERFAGAAIHPMDGSRIAVSFTRSAGVVDLFVSSNVGKSWKHLAGEGGTVPVSNLAFDPTDRDCLLLIQRSGPVTAYNCETGQHETICSKRPGLNLDTPAVSSDGRTIWAAALGNGIWILQRE